MNMPKHNEHLKTIRLFTAKPLWCVKIKCYISQKLSVGSSILKRIGHIYATEPTIPYCFWVRKNFVGQRMKFMIFTFLFTYFGMIGLAMGGDKFSEQGNSLIKALIGQLINEGVCKDIRSCNDILQMYREDDNGRVYLNMYGQTDTALTSKVISFLVTHGTKITGGLGITLHVFSGSHEHNHGVKQLFRRSQEVIKLEINK